MKFPADITIGELYDPAMQITDQAEADAYFEALVERQQRCFGRTRDDAEAVERSNLGYFAGYYDNEARQRIERLFSARHPIFGSAEPTASEALLAGAVAATSGVDAASSLFAMGQAIERADSGASEAG